MSSVRFADLTAVVDIDGSYRWARWGLPSELFDFQLDHTLGCSSLMS
jgi:hypothetical protein